MQLAEGTQKLEARLQAQQQLATQLSSELAEVKEGLKTSTAQVTQLAAQVESLKGQLEETRSSSLAQLWRSLSIRGRHAAGWLRLQGTAVRGLPPVVWELGKPWAGGLARAAVLLAAFLAVWAAVLVGPPLGQHVRGPFNFFNALARPG